jgi:micrococcal nuclease
MKLSQVGILTLLILLSSFAAAQDCLSSIQHTTSANPKEASGVVSKVADGDTVDVDGVGRVRLADIDCPELDAPGGPEAKDFTTSHLLNKTVYLDIDGLQRSDPYGRLVAVLYLKKPDGSFVNFNRMLVEAGQACIWDHKENEFSPADWWGGKIPNSVCIKGVFPATAASSPAILQSPFVGSTGPGKFPKHHPKSCSASKRRGNEKLIIIF